jgi:dTDP-glucose 4,6-dehydratase
VERVICRHSDDADHISPFGKAKHKPNQIRSSILSLEIHMNWSSGPVLVTGAGGFIGSHLVEALVLNGAKVRTFIHYNSRSDRGLLTFLPESLLEEIEIVFGDLRDPLAVRQAVEGTATVFHLGAVISIPYSYLHPFEVAETNLMGTLNVLQACRELEIERLVHTSSSEVYGTALQVPINEDHRLQGQSPYSASKIGADKLAESYYCAYDLPVVTLRPFNTYGPRQSSRAIVPTIITQALASDAVRLGNTTPRRDLTFVSDTVEGFLKIAQTSEIEGETFNLGTGSEVSIGDLAQRIIRLSGREVKVEAEDERMRPEGSEVLRLLSDSSLARERLGWESKVSLEDGLRRTIEWISDNMHHYEVGTYQV